MMTLPFNHPEFYWDFLQVKSSMGVTPWDGCVIHDAFGMSSLCRLGRTFLKKGRSLNQLFSFVNNLVCGEFCCKAKHAKNAL